MGSTVAAHSSLVILLSIALLGERQTLTEEGYREKQRERERQRDRGTEGRLWGKHRERQRLRDAQATIWM